MVSDRSSRHRRRSTGFTLVEIIIVLVIITIFAAIATPVVLNQDRRQIDHTASQIADMLLMYAQRESMHPDPPGLYYDAGLREIQMLTLPNDEGASDVGWQIDSYVDPIVLPESIELISVSADSEQVDISSWPLSTRINEIRPSIRMTIDGGGRIITIELLPHSLAPRIIEQGSTDQVTRQPQDLDGQGRSREEW